MSTFLFQLPDAKDHKLLAQLNFKEKQILMVKVVTMGMINAASAVATNTDEEVRYPFYEMIIAN